ncbi:hypothetical protein LIPSTDRAFT_75781 [Lipomyces starkeyi NRRL Y-11557]|uniref:Uncharacterized protein n=1 Tax=Lipomyces starkeyi NRRL Y-11557 TaxID=675824 RepID=A0A1E3PVW1_LIPST|nr:hypothetical protein LIPSTDRAFT_75781 [Lipomyces starkeyi NRRL Y-11557]
MRLFDGQEEKEIYKTWVEAKSCPKWRDGWCSLDGALIPTFVKPHYYRFYDRKHNYSISLHVRIFVYFVHICSY